MIRKKRQRKITNKTLLIGKSRLKQFDSRAPEIEPKHTVPRTSHHCKHDVTPENTQGIQGVRQKAWRIRKLLPENTSKHDAVLDEVVRMEKIDTGVRRKLQYEKRTSLTKEVIKLTKLKAQRDFGARLQYRPLYYIILIILHTYIFPLISSIRGKYTSATNILYKEKMKFIFI